MQLVISWFNLEKTVFKLENEIIYGTITHRKYFWGMLSLRIEKTLSLTKLKKEQTQ